jgi:uncharacterized SAM-binding protein YcdF (DUF218 family)
MIQAIVDVLKIVARPSSVTFLVSLLAAGVALAFVKRTQRAARWYFAAVFAAYWIFASPACAERLVLWKGGAYRSLTSAADARGARVVVVLGAGNFTIQAHGLSINQVTWEAGLRLLEAARLYRLLDRPTIIVSGGVTQRERGAASEADAMRTTILGLGVPSDRIVVEAESKNTREEAIIIARMLKDQGGIPSFWSPRRRTCRRSGGVSRPRHRRDPFRGPVKSGIPSKVRWVPSDLSLMLWVCRVTPRRSCARARGWLP